MAESSLTGTYLKAVYNDAEWSGRPVTVGGLAGRLGLAPSSVSEHVRKLTDRGLLAHAPYGAIELTPEGRRIALGMVRKHRLIEVFLVDYLGYTWDEVHDEAEALENAVSDTFVDRLSERLGEPAHDPHGDPIPASDGTLPDDEQVRLDEVEPGTRVRIARVWDDDPELLRHLDELGLAINTDVLVKSRHDSAGTMTLQGDSTITVLGISAAGAIRVVLEQD